MTRPIFLLTDFGTADTYVGIVKAVILSTAPESRIVGLTHDIPPQDIRAGAFALLTAVPYLPADAVVLAVVDPGVGTDRRPIAVQVGGRTFVGPDNGLLSWAVQNLTRPAGREDLSPPTPRTGAVSGEQIVVLDRPDYWLPNVSATFHGRDIFGPVAAHLASGVRLQWVGSPIDALVTIPYPEPQIVRDEAALIQTVTGEIIHMDRYGNLISNLRASDLPTNPWVTVGNEAIPDVVENYQAAGSRQLIALIGSAGLLEIAVPNGNAASHLKTGVGARVTVTTEPPRRLPTAQSCPQAE